MADYIFTAYFWQRLSDDNPGAEEAENEFMTSVFDELDGVQDRG